MLLLCGNAYEVLCIIESGRQRRQQQQQQQTFAHDECSLRYFVTTYLALSLFDSGSTGVSS